MGESAISKICAKVSSKEQYTRSALRDKVIKAKAIAIERAIGIKIGVSKELMLTQLYS